MIEIVIEFEPKVVWQSDNAASYNCPYCDIWLRTQYEGQGIARIKSCGGRFGTHIIEIDEDVKR